VRHQSSSCCCTFSRSLVSDDGMLDPPLPLHGGRAICLRGPAAAGRIKLPRISLTCPTPNWEPHHGAPPNPPYPLSSFAAPDSSLRGTSVACHVASSARGHNARPGANGPSLPSLPSFCPCLQTALARTNGSAWCQPCRRSGRGEGRRGQRCTCAPECRRAIAPARVYRRQSALH